MDKAHDLKILGWNGAILRARVDGVEHEFDLAKESSRLAAATQQQRERVEVSPGGYGLHWPDLDEDLSIDRLLGVRHQTPLLESRR
ncbi:MAG: DUF2442 domain-containing protein [Candidatus Hydrogenedentes bacterium]|nr:DUF2442 domain-containing protein [Candidatus Hydrogenedentota bacterium]